MDVQKLELLTRIRLTLDSIESVHDDMAYSSDVDDSILYDWVYSIGEDLATLRSLLERCIGERI